MLMFLGTMCLTSRRLAIVLLGVLLCTGAARAQTGIRLEKVVNVPPHRFVRFTAECDGQPVTRIDSAAIRIQEGLPFVTDFTITPPDTSISCRHRFCVMVDLSDTSAAMRAHLRAALRSFVDTLQPGDEAELCWYGNGADLAQPMTGDKGLLYAAIDGMPVAAPLQSSLFSLFDERVRAIPVQQGWTRAMVLMNGSLDTSESLPNAARAAIVDSAGIRVSFIRYLGRSSTWPFQAIATASRGLVYSTFPDSSLGHALTASYRLQRLNNPGTYFTLRLPYRKYRCDFSMRPTVHVIWDGCMRAVWDDLDVPDWMDSSEVTSVRFLVDGARSFGGCLLPLTIRAEQGSETPLRIGSDAVTVTYDTTRLRLIENSTIGTLLERLGPVAYPTRTRTGFHFNYTIKDTIRYHGPLLHCTFLVAEGAAPRVDTIRVRRTGWTSLCYLTSAGEALIEVQPRALAPRARFSFPANLNTSDDSALVPLYVSAVDSGAMDFSLAELAVYFSATRTDCSGIAQKPGTLFADGQVGYAPGRGGGLLRFAPGTRFTRPGVVCYLRFKALIAQDTAAHTITPGGAELAAGCIYPEMEKGSIRFNQGSTGTDWLPDAADPLTSLSMYPQPAGGRLTLRLGLARETDLRLHLVSILGQELASYHCGSRAAGMHEFALDRPRGGGLNFLRIVIDGKQRRNIPLLWSAGN